MRKLLNNKKTLLVWVLVLALAITGCSFTKSIVGKWENDTLGITMQFFKDGTVISGILNGTYTQPDKNHLRIELQGWLGLVGPQVFEYTIEDDQLILTDGFGNKSAWTRVK